MEKVRVGVVGCGNVSEPYLTHLRESAYAEVVGVCDLIPERFRRRMAEFGVPRGFASVDEMLAGLEFDLLINITSMPEHFGVNLKGLSAGRHVWSEKPCAPTYVQGRQLLELAREKGVRFWGAPTAVSSPQFRCMAEILARGEVGEVHAAHGCYGHGGPTWGPWFYREGGGCLGDLAVYNITTLTGLLGPAKSVTALMGTVIPEREIEGECVRVTAEDNAMLLVDHGNNAFSHIQAGFVYPIHRDEATIELIGTRGAMGLLGWDWAPRGVRIRTVDRADWETRCTDARGYVWQGGGSYAAECLAKGVPGPITAEHAIHVVDIMAGAKESAQTGRHIAIASTFPWPLAL